MSEWLDTRTGEVVKFPTNDNYKIEAEALREALVKDMEDMIEQSIVERILKKDW